jgi:hypothetical protein
MGSLEQSGFAWLSCALRRFTLRVGYSGKKRSRKNGNMPKVL